MLTGCYKEPDYGFILSGSRHVGDGEQVFQQEKNMSHNKSAICVNKAVTLCSVDSRQKCFLKAAGHHDRGGMTEDYRNFS